ncbi:MAG: UDP-2,3-diacylglucosamine diphosphatase LpxI [Pseudomonadota bacterium]|nr:UDP-2,3-diacylglucosamine diphosphatase LpxI [Pseudomonadota bacterium]
MKLRELASTEMALFIGGGDLPSLVVESLNKRGIPFILVCFDGTKINIPVAQRTVLNASFANIAQLFDDLKKMNIKKVAFCGYVTPPQIEFKKIDSNSHSILTKLTSKLEKGDSVLFDEVVHQFRKRCLQIINLFELIPTAFAKQGFLTKRRPSEADIRDTIRAEQLFSIISKADLGQSLVVEDGVCLGVETSPGTDALLGFILKIVRKKDNKLKLKTGGVLYKAPKSGQSMLIDIPVIGEKTVRNVKKSGLNGIVLKEQKVIILNKERTLKLANDLDIFIWSK